jgi:hypothetical protein
VNTPDDIRQYLARQAASSAMMGSPFMAALLSLLSERLTQGTAVGARVLGWQGPAGSKDDALALRLAAGLHALVLSGRDPDLAAHYPPARLNEAALWPAVVAALDRHDGHLMAWLDSPPQTNDVLRAAPLIAAAHWLTATFDLPIALTELGASAGLNLLWDQFALQVGGEVFGPEAAAIVLDPVWRGPPPPKARPVVVDRLGVDLNPLHPEGDQLRLLSYIWADQAARLQRTRAALDLARRMPPPVVPGEAADWAERRLARPMPGHLHILYHTIAWQYFPGATRARILAALDRAGADATDDAPLAHLWVEADQSSPGAQIGLTLWPGALRLDLGRADFHGRWVNWVDPLA